MEAHQEGNTWKPQPSRKRKKVGKRTGISTSRNTTDMIKIGHVNAQSIKNKFLFIVNFLHENRYDILRLTESFFKDQHSLPSIPGYISYRINANGTNKRGIIIFVSTKLKSWELKVNNISDNTEILSFKIQLDFLKSIQVTCIFRHPNYKKNILNNDIKNIEIHIASLMEKDNEFIIVGDFNLRDNTSQELIAFSEAHKIKQIVNVPTRNNQILDLIFVRDHSKVLNCKVFNAL